MSEYIANLTDHLIRTAHFDAIEEQIPLRGNVLNHITLSLEAGEVRKMKPETLGKIVCAFEHGDVAVSKKEIMQNVMFGGNCEDFLRGIVAYFLAVVIIDRLADDQVSSYPKFRR